MATNILDTQNMMARFEEHADNKLRPRVEQRPLQAVAIVALAGFAAAMILPASVNLIVARKLVWLGLGEMFSPRQ